MTTHRAMDVELSIDDQEEIWEQRRQKLEALMGADPAQPDKIMDPLLLSVAKEGDIDKFIRALEHYCAKERVSLPFLLGLRSPSKNTLLHAAAESDDNVRAIINFVPKHLISCQNSRGETPLHIAARAGKTGAVKLLLPQGNPTCIDHSGNSALHEAVRICHYEVIRQLVRKDPNPLYRQNEESKSPWCLVVETGNLEVLKLLLEAPNDGEDQKRSESESVFGMSPVHLAIMYKNMDMLTKMWEKKSWLFQLRDAGYGTPLHFAAYRNYLDGVKFLIEKFPTSALEQDKMGYLPIHVACMMDHVRIVKELLRQWQDPTEFPSRLGQNILHVSASYGSIKTVIHILKSPKFGHLINARDFDGNTPLHLAALHCQPSVVLLAGDKRVDRKLVNKNNMTALDVVEQDIKTIRAQLPKRLTHTILVSTGTPRSGELAICKPTGRRPWKRLGPPESDFFKGAVNTRMVVVGLMASVTFTSGFSVPGGYNDSNPDAGISILLHKTMYNVFVFSNSIAMYSSIKALVMLLWTDANDPYVTGLALDLSNLQLLVTLAAMPLAFMAGVYVTVTKLAWLSTFVLVCGSFALFIIIYIFIVVDFLPLSCRNPLTRGFTDIYILVGLIIANRETAGYVTAGGTATFVRGTHNINLLKSIIFSLIMYECPYLWLFLSYG